MEKPDQSIIIFDCVCNLCEYSVRFIVKNDRQARFKFHCLVSTLTLQSKAV
ncbi:MAG: DUF393 domain-containing protein [Deltaproteobacteria bacterium]|nr:DUF393 domain-containing protein [Deltaproteobacteria bacterium]